MKPTNIYLSGVGGQGIGLLADVLARACIEAGYDLIGCDTHGLAQRGGTVVSHLRIGKRLFGPLIPKGGADIVVSLERLEALRATREMLKPGGLLVYYDSVYQPIHVRTGRAEYPEAEQLAREVKELEANLERVFIEDLPDARMQNVALLGRLAAAGAIEGVGVEVVSRALEDAVPPKVFEANKAVFEKAAR